MFATINLPGSNCFYYYGPANKKECEVWIDETVDRLLNKRGRSLTSTLPRQIISNKEAAKWKYLDGSHVFDYFRPTR